ncbi:MAG: thioredoxin, partial [Deltaproteobacteria bacterium]|nr:thioredoxin [Deltaproteobacteria bacterium]
PETPEEIKGKSGRDVEVARMPGLFKPATFLGMYRYVRENQYKSGKHFQKYFAEIIEDLRKQLGAMAGM